MSGFVHLHLHSGYSLLDGACRINEIAEAAAREGHCAVALTDHGAMYGAVEFYRACKAAGVKPIIGCEVYVAPKSRFDRDPAAKYNHLVLLVENEIGYRNLCRMVSLSFTEGFYSKPRVDYELLTEYSEGLIALSGCLGGIVPSMILASDFDGALREAERLRDIFGKDSFYLELQDHGMPEQKKVNRALLEISGRSGIPLVATNDVHYIRRSDAGAQRVLMAIAMQSTADEVGFGGEEHYFKSEAEMAQLFSSYSGAIENTVAIAERCSYDFDFSSTYLPRYVPEDGSDPYDYLSRLTMQGLESRIASGAIVFAEGRAREDYIERAEHELGIIHQMGYDEYFLIVLDFVGYAKSHGIPTGPGRGSGAGSLVAFLVGITDVDSLKYGLLFERFLNPERVSMPDFDIDFSDERREEVIRYVEEKYGSDRVCQIITFGTLSARAAVRDVGRVLGYTYKDVDAVAKLIPRAIGVSLDSALKTKALASVYESDENARRLIDMARLVEGLPRHTSTHAAGVVIAEKPVWTYLPLAVSCGTLVTQYDMDTVAALGLLKFDFLGLRYLTVISDAERAVRECEPSFSVEAISEDDSETFALISRGDTGGVFQLESAGMRRMLTSFRPNCISDIMAAIALYRPGPMESIPRYIAVRGGEKPDYLIPELEPILAPTCGCIVYQEQVMQICRAVAGYSFGRADIVRRAMSKKKHEVMERERGDFVDGAASRGISREKASALFDELTRFASYAFNKSHAAAYSLTSYRTAYLKAHYRAEYMAALLTSVRNNTDKLSEYMTECRRAGISILPPSVSDGDVRFRATGDGIRFALSAVKNIGEGFAAQIIEERANRPFSSVYDFVSRMAVGMNKRQLESLIRSGALDSFGVTRSSLAAEYEHMLDELSHRASDGVEGQIGLFDAAEDTAIKDYEFPDLAELPIEQRLAQEKESTGFYFSGHPLDRYRADIQARGALTVSALRSIALDGEGGENVERSEYTIGGMVSSVSEKRTKKGDMMAFVTLEDESLPIELIVFPRVYEQCRPYLTAGSPIAVRGRPQLGDDDEKRTVSLIASAIEPLRAGAVTSSGASGAAVSGMRAANGQREASASGTPTMSGHADAAAGRNSPSAQPHLSNTSPNTSDTPRYPQAAEKIKLFVRVPDMKCESCKRAENLFSIFELEHGAPGARVMFYDSSNGEYRPRSGGDVALSTVMLGELRTLLGEENVALRRDR